MQAPCPVCQGSGRVPLSESELNYSWNRGKTTKECQNCGGQYMFGKGTGKVNVNKQGEPCQHKYRGETAGRCLTRYTCTECGDRYEIDSSD